MRGPHYSALLYVGCPHNFVPLYVGEREEGTGTTEEFGATPVA